MNIKRKVFELAAEIKEAYPTLTQQGTLLLAAQIVHTEVIKEAFMVNEADRPSVLEAIAMQLGAHAEGDFGQTVPEALAQVEAAIRAKK